MVFYEVSFTSGSTSLDGSPVTVLNSAASTTQPGVTLTLTGTSDFIVQYEFGSGANYPSAISGGYSIAPSSANFYQSTSAYLANTASGAAPTWTFSTSQNEIGGALAFK